MKNEMDNRPSWVFRILFWFCPTHLYEEIEGDLIQKYDRDLKNLTKGKAKRRLIWNMIRFFRPGIIFRHKPKTSFMPLYMIGNYFKVATRVMMRDKTYTTINVLGLTLGIAGAMLLSLWIEKEFSFDQFHTDKERIYKAWNRDAGKDGISCWDYTPRILAPTLQAEYPGVERATSYGSYNSSYLFTAGEKRLMNSAGAFVDPQFLTMFSFPLIKGDASKVLNNPNSIVLTESFAKQLLGDREPFGETISIGESGFTFPFVITGILKNLPSNTDFHFDYLVPWQFLESIGEKDTFWGNNSVSTYVKLKAGEDVAHFNNLVKDVVKEHSNEGSSNEIFLYPLTKMRLYSSFHNGVASGGRIEIIRMLSILGLCLIAIACINFINLSTARAQKRSKEVGIRKVTGANRFSLISQFLCESVLVALGAGVISIGIVYLSLPWFGTLIQQPLTLNIQQLSFWLITFSLVTFIGIVAGVYPAFYLSSFHPVRILKGSTVVTSGRNALRQLLVVFQLGFAIMLMVSVVVINKQIQFAQNREVGYDKNHLIYHSITGDLAKNYQAYKNELLSSGVATSVTQTSSPITERWSNNTDMRWRGKDRQDKTSIERFYIDEDITITAGLTLLEGRDMDLKQYPSDSTSVLLNEAAVKLMGFKQPIGEIIEDNDIEWHVIGVVKDFVLTSPLQKITPIVLQGCKKKEMLGVVHIRLNPDHSAQSNIATVSSLFSKFNPSYPFEYHFVDDVYQRKFAMLETTLTITSLFGFIAILISCLGLLGLSTFMIETRTKEIGIRKVLGSSVTNIIRLLSTDALKPIVVAILLFSPVAWYSMNWWLESFDYRISLDAWIFLAAGLIVLTIALVTISVQTFGAANTDPVKTLRME